MASVCGLLCFYPTINIVAHAVNANVTKFILLERTKQLSALAVLGNSASSSLPLFL